MGAITSAFARAFRDFVTDGVPSSGIYEPEKTEQRAIGPLIEAALGALSLASVDVIKDTRANLDADLAHAADSIALVYADATDANNDLYVKSGASGAGSWTLTTILHDAIEGAIAAKVTELVDPKVALAEEWAENPEDDQVTGAPGQFSARHWAAKSEYQTGIAAQQVDLAAEKVGIAAAYVAQIEDKATLLEQHDYRITALEDRYVVPVGGILEAEIMGPTGMPALAGTIPGNGKMLRIRFKGIGTSSTINVARASLTAIRPGFGLDRILKPDNVVEDLAVTALYRLAFPSEASKLMEVVGSDVDTYWAISASVFVSDRVYNLNVQAGFFGACVDSNIAVIENNSTRPYEMPQVDLIAQPPIMRLGSDGLSWEWAVMHHAARFLQTVAAVECYIVDNTANPSAGNRIASIATSMTPSTRLWPHTPPVFAGTFANPGILDDGLGGMSVKVYPWIGTEPWDLAAHGGASVLDSSLPAYWPVCIDSDDSYKTARAYVSHTGAQIGSPTLTTGALAAYNPGVTAAYASVAALFAAGQTWNNSGSNRARPHNDAGGLEAVLPNGTIIAGFGASLAGYFSGDGPLPRVTRAGGADITTTGIAPGTFKTVRHIDIDGVGMFPTTGSGHIIVDGSSAGATATAPANWSAAVITVVRNCKATSAGDAINVMLYRQGYAFNYNNDFTGPEPALANYLWRQSCVIHGGKYDSSAWRSAPTRLFACPRVIGGHFIQLVPEAENAARTFHFETGQFFGWNRVDYFNSPGTNPVFGSHRAAIGARGLAVVGNLFRQTGTTLPGMQIHADYASGADRPACRNVNVFGNSVPGGRYNRKYIEVGANTVIKEGYEFFNAFESVNCKTDTTDPDGGGPLAPNGARTGNFAFRHGTDRGWNRIANTSAAGSTYSPTSFLGDAAPRGDVISIGNANMFVNDTSTGGSNTAANFGDYEPAAALRNAIPAYRAPWLCDYLGTVIPNDGAGAAGALQLA